MIKLQLAVDFFGKRKESKSAEPVYDPVTSDPAPKKVQKEAPSTPPKATVPTTTASPAPTSPTPHQSPTPSTPYICELNEITD